MSEPTTPKPQPHHGYQSWTSSWRDDQGRPHSRRFGRVGKVSKREAYNRFRQFIVDEYPKLAEADQVRYSVKSLCTDWLDALQNRYTIDGKRTASANKVQVALESFAAMYGEQEADAMTAGKVAAWLESFISERRKKGGRGTRGGKAKETVNTALTYIKRMFKWGHVYRGVSASATGSVVLVENIRSDHPAIARLDPVPAVPLATVEETLKHCPQVVRDMVMLQWWSGMRPGEVLAVRGIDLKHEADDLMTYRPTRHKNTWRKKARIVALGPKSVAIISKRMTTNLEARLFLRPDGKAWDSQAYRKAIAKAARAAKVKTWKPNQLRHSAATRVAETFGAEDVQHLLGHANLNQQAVYVERSVKKALRLAKEVG